MASFVDHCIEAAGPGEIIDTCRDGTLHHFKKMFVCPYKDTLRCPKTELYSDDSPHLIVTACNMSPIVDKQDGRSFCDIVVDLDSPTCFETLNGIGELIAFRNEKGEQL